MKLKRLEIYGFKSFADKTLIQFNEGITGIVGPNGSGKSNIGDAVRWVLGEQNARILRGSKMEDVIFGGTAQRKASNYCEVSLVFDNEDHSLRTEFSEVMVTRRVYRSGESEYYLNKNACRLKDILELFRDTGIGREGYSLIGQGRIDEILSAKSDDRRQVFEEAAGVMTFRFRKEEAERKLERTRDNLSRVNDIIGELEDRLEPLQRQAETARVYLDLSQRLRELEIEIFVIRYDRSKARMDDLKKNLDGLMQAIGEHEREIAENTRERDSLQEAMSRLDDLIDEAREEENRISAQMHRTRGEVQSISQRLDVMAERRGRTEKDLKENAERIAALEGMTETDGEKVRRMEEEVRRAREKSDAEEKVLDEAIRRSDEAERELDEHKNRILAAVNRLSDVRNQEARAQAVHAQMTVRLEELLGGRDDLIEKEKELQSRLEEAQRGSAEADARLKEKTLAAEKQRAETEKCAAELRELSERTQQAHLKQETDMSRLRLLSDMSREMEGYNQAVKQALRFGRNDPGVCDIVAKLIHVPREYETAIDMVLGGTLQNIVTRDENAAKRLIDYLRVNRLGRATFLPITSVRARLLSGEERRLLSMDGCIGVASELVGFDEEYRGVIENLLGRTVIARDLESGIAIMRAGRHAFRLVTLAGDVMHSGGSMTGGTANRTAASLLSREREITDLKASTAAGKEALEQMRREVEIKRALRDEMRLALAAAGEEVHQEEIACAREQEHVANAADELDAHRQNMQRSEEAIAQLRLGIRGIEEDLKKASELTEETAYDRENMDAETVRLQERLKKCREETDRQREILKQCRDECTEAVHRMDILGRDARQREEELSGARTLLLSLREQAAAMDREAEETRQRLSSASALAEETENQDKECQEKVSVLEGRRREISELQRQNNRSGDEMRTLYEQDTQRAHRMELNLNKAEGEINTLCDHMFNAYEITYANALELRRPSDKPFEIGKGEKEAAELRRSIRDMGTVNVGAIEEYADTRERYDGLTTQRDDLIKAEDDLEHLIERLLKQMESQFVEEFAKLDAYFRVTFARLFGGGHAELKLTDPGDALNSAIEIIAQPPGKKLQMLSLLSGGERALTAIAILFAMLKLKPTPFCILDEIEAALDEANIGYFADYLAEYKTGTQFVVVTHRKGTMERCDALYGVAMQEHGVSRMVSVDLKDYE